MSLQLQSYDPHVSWAEAIHDVVAQFPEARFAAITSIDSNHSPVMITADIQQRSGLKSEGNVYPLESILAIDLENEHQFSGFDELWLLTSYPGPTLEQPIHLYNLSESNEEVHKRVEIWMQTHHAVVGLDSAVEILKVTLALEP